MFRFFDIGGRFVGGCGLALTLFAPLSGASASASESVLYAFKGGKLDGAYPVADVIADSSGNLYGTTQFGGGTGCGGKGCGTVFKVTPSGTETVLHAFRDGNDGAEPTGDLVADGEGNLYGTTQYGGGYNCGGCGTVFEIKADGKEKVLFSFNNIGGLSPVAGLTLDANGNLYGTTALGGHGGGCSEGNTGCGTVFRLSPDGKETVLHAFNGGKDGYVPAGKLNLDSSGNLFGTTVFGGGTDCGHKAGCGTVFELATDGKETVMYAFRETGGVHPTSGLIADNAGNLYGTTSYSGNCGNRSGCGTVFELTPVGMETTVYSFCEQKKCVDGYNPESGLIAGGAGNLYGTTSFGGYRRSKHPYCPKQGCGIVFKLAPDGTETVLDFFQGGSDGFRPAASLFADSAGNLYGTTEYGGGACKQDGCGTVFKIAK